MGFARSGRFYVYIVKCSDGTYYTGYTPDIEKRLKLHNSGRGARYTRDRRPVKLIWRREFKYFKNAFLEEKRIKGLTRQEKAELVRSMPKEARGGLIMPVNRKSADGKIGEKYMRLAIKKARENLKKMAGGPFGACIVKSGRVLAVARNTVLMHDATCHAEINAIRAASRKTGSFDLSGAVIYSTTEPCPMCFCAIHWARIGLVIYGTGIKDAEKIGFNEMKVGNARLKRLAKCKVDIVPGFLREECRKLFGDWRALPDRRVY